MRLPVYAFERHGDPKADSVSEAVQAGRVMVVDDNADAADMLAELLRIDGHEVAVAYSGVQALDTASGFKPAVVFLDIGLPDMSGYELAGSMREVDGMQDARDRELAMNAGFDEHVVKPIDFAKIGSLQLKARASR